MPEQAVVDAIFAQARRALDRGDSLLQISVQAGLLSGTSSSWGSTANDAFTDPDVGWLLGQVEALGWRLEHTGFSFVETGSSTSQRLLSSGEGRVNQGAVHGFYVFRRRDATS